MVVIINRISRNIEKINGNCISNNMSLLSEIIYIRDSIEKDSKFEK